MNHPDGPHGGTKQERIEQIWTDIDDAMRERDQYLARVDEIEFEIKELKAELHDVLMGAL